MSDDSDQFPETPFAEIDYVRKPASWLRRFADSAVEKFRAEFDDIDQQVSQSEFKPHQAMLAASSLAQRIQLVRSHCANDADTVQETRYPAFDSALRQLVEEIHGYAVEQGWPGAQRLAQFLTIDPTDGPHSR